MERPQEPSLQSVEKSHMKCEVDVYVYLYFDILSLYLFQSSELISTEKIHLVKFHHEMIFLFVLLSNECVES